MDFDGRNWCVLQVAPRAELRIAGELARLGAQVYVPLETRRARHARRTETVKVPLFPGYVFSAVEGRFHIARSVRQTRGWLLSAGAPAVIPSAFLHRLHQAETARMFHKARRAQPPQHALKVRDPVRFKAGPFSGQIGEIERLDGVGRVRVLLSLFGREHVVDAQANGLEPVGSGESPAASDAT